ncbi:hypothetical protein L1987_49005 [Smallanthus sonchifolius]|uniref:Uncharacterized protein n=1 Tax=Smallanthus sonchifolius TaxID=185202 RepID=A0ACB9FT99_9ASTR|nr:hypothetical protein L1987_49005 [Smallanthus sonchifolius]
MEPLQGVHFRTQVQGLERQLAHKDQEITAPIATKKGDTTTYVDIGNIRIEKIVDDDDQGEVYGSQDQAIEEEMFDKEEEEEEEEEGEQDDNDVSDEALYKLYDD